MRCGAVDLRGQIEPSAFELAGAVPGAAVGTIAEISIAISLKRLADVADATAMQRWLYDPTRNPDGTPKP